MGGHWCWQGPCPRGPGRAPCAQLLHLCGVQVCEVLHGAWVEAIVPLLDHGVEYVSKHLEASRMMGTMQTLRPTDMALLPAWGMWQQGSYRGWLGPWWVLPSNAIAIHGAAAAPARRRRMMQGSRAAALKEPRVLQGHTGAGQGASAAARSGQQEMGTDILAAGCTRGTRLPQAELPLTS